MAFTGPAPKQYRRNRNPLGQDWTEVPDVPFTAAPKLPPQRDNGQPWPQAALRQWRMWARMPICSLWDESDWGFAMRALEVLIQWQEAGTAALASEVRLMERTMGVTADARRSMRIRYVDSLSSQGGDGAGAISLEQYRDL